MISKNASSIPPPVRQGVTVFAVIAIAAVGGLYMINRILGHIVWYTIGIGLVGVAIYLFVLRSE